MDLQEAKKRAVGMLLGYKDNETQIKMLEAELEALKGLQISNMAVSYDQPPGGKTNKVNSPVESELVQLEAQWERVEVELMRRRVGKRQIDIALDSMSVEKRMLLKLKYIERQIWKQVYQQISYSEDYIHKELKHLAIESFAYCLFPELYQQNLFAVNLSNPQLAPNYEQK